MTGSATLPNPARAETLLLLKRIDNIKQSILAFLSQLPAEEQLSLLTLSDDEFWAEAHHKARIEQIVNLRSAAKTEQEEFAENRVAFMDSLQKYGGVHKTSTVEKIIHVRTPTVIKYGEKNKLIVLNWGAENLYPVFQFSITEHLSEKGMLRGVPALLAAMRPDVSAVRKCNFFTRKIELPGTGEKTSVLAVLQRGASQEEMAWFLVLADNFGTQNAV